MGIRGIADEERHTAATKAKKYILLVGPVSDRGSTGSGSSVLNALNPLNAADMLFTALDTPMAIGTSLVKAAGGGGWVNPFSDDVFFHRI